jgi:type I restriction enzyme S subunit
VIFKSYPKYIPCSIQWFTEIPQGWKEVRVEQYLVKKDENIGSLWSSTQLLSLTQKGVIEKDINDGKGKTHSDYSTYQAIDKGDLVFCLFDIDETPRTVGLSTKKGMITSAYTAFKSKENINTQYVYYFFESLDDAKALKPYYKGLRKTVRPPEFLKIHVPFPPKEEQDVISKFLDSETSRIDNLIAKQEKLIELLEEQRKSIISHAVTKGLNPNAPMKDSGVEWLGEVPEHWDVAVVKRAFIVKLGKMLQPDQKDETDVIKKYLKASNLTWDGVKDIDNEMWFSKNDLKKLKLEIGDLLVAEGGDVGKSCIFDSNEEFYYQNSVNRVRGQKNNANKFLYYWLFTLKYSGYIDILCNKSTIAHFTAEKLNETILLLPDSVEQNEIIAYLERENGKINQLILKQQSLIEKLKEYRASIISHAVTGKIDVMEFGA